MKHGTGTLTHKRWLCALVAVSLLMAVSLSAAAGATGVVRNPNGGSYVNLRSWGSYSAPVLATIGVGTAVEILHVDGAWYCVVANGITGYMHTNFVSTSGGNVQTAIVNAGPLNVRETPSTQSRVLMQLQSGAVVSVLWYGSSWTQIRVGDVWGYVLTSYLSFDGASSNQPAQPITTEGANATIRTKNGGNLNMRSWASTSAPVVGSYANGSRVRVLTHGASWCRVQAGSEYGYMVTQYLSFDGGSSGGGTSTERGYDAVVNNPGIAQALNLRKEPSTSSQSLGQFYNGTSVKVLGVGTEWHRVQVNGVEGYMVADYVKIISTSATPHKTVANNGRFVNLRSGAGYGYSVLKRVNDGSAATVVIPYSLWSKVIVKDGSGYLTGYMMNSFLK